MSRFTDALRHVEKERNQLKKKDPFNIDPKVGKIFVSTPTLREQERKRRSRRTLMVFLFLALAFTLVYGAGLYRGLNNMELETISESEESASTHLLPLAESELGNAGPSEVKESSPDGTTDLNEQLLDAIEPAQTIPIEPLIHEETKAIEASVELPFYTVQLIAYDNLQRAFEEVAKIKDQGFDAFVCTKSPVYSVCAAKVKDKAEASAEAADIKRKTGLYADAYVKKVSFPLPDLKNAGN